MAAPRFKLPSFLEPWARRLPSVLRELFLPPPTTAGAPPSRQPAGGGSETGEVWRAMLAAMPDAALVLDSQGTVVAINAAARSTLGAEAGRHITQVSRSPELIAAIERATRSRASQTCRVRILVPVERHLEGHVTPLAGSDAPAGSPALLIALRDLTEQDRLARMRADFVANASHELRTPLAALRGFVETLQGAAKDDAIARERFLGIMSEQAVRMSRLIEDLLSLSRIEMREHVAPSDRVDIDAVASEVARLLAPMAEKAGIAIAVERGDGLLRIVADRDEMVQLTQNLAQNAIKYGRRGGHVRLRVERRGAQVALVVADDGIGIAPEHIPRLTERFYRVSAKDSRERGGTGLGLAIVKHIVNRHNGQLAVASTLGQGTTITVLMPATGSEK